MAERGLPAGDGRRVPRAMAFARTAGGKGNEHRRTVRVGCEGAPRARTGAQNG
jgi:hypothetical protein